GHGDGATRFGFVHQALCYGSDAAFLDGTLDFVHDGLDAGDPVLAVVAPHNVRLLGEALGDHAQAVELIDADEWYDQPPRTLGRYHAYCGDHGTGPAGRPRRVRVIGEPVWSGRTAFETGEWMRYESLVNVAFADSPHWILCPYDTRALSDDLALAAARTHPVLGRASGTPAASVRYTDPGAFYAECARVVPRALPDGPDDVPFLRGGTAAVRRSAAAHDGHCRAQLLAGAEVVLEDRPHRGEARVAVPVHKVSI
ncbi:MEDS domain-containing protein, partial [Streptomyces sp. NPDC059785]|uniref:MEDS domain-containing protein n=1 Tax=Streptomyces sp. NPDC059785 TaxID=3346945 RepID=UPI00365DE2D4